MPKFQDDDFALLGRELRQAAHCSPFLRRFAIVPFEPAHRLQLSREPAPEAALVVQCPVAKAAQAVVQRLLWCQVPLQQSHKRLLQDVLGLAVAKPKRAAIQKYLRRVRLVEALAPVRHRHIQPD